MTTAEHYLPLDRGRLGLALDELTWTWACDIAGLDAGNTSLDPGPDNGDDATQATRLARLRVLKHVARHLDLLTEQTAGLALDHGADLDDIATALGVTRQAVRKRFGHLLRLGDSVAVVISRRDRVRHDPDDPRGAYGEIGGPDQYAADRGLWSVGRAVRDQADHAVVAVDGTVRRIYALDPDGWTEVSPGKWQFTAVGDQPMDDASVRAGVAAGHIPLGIGDDCPTRIGGAYRPHWF